jgi:uncharacterized protein (TIGR02246 family)
MVYRNYFKLATFCVVLTILSIGCKAPSTDESPAVTEATAEPAAEMPDMAAVKVEIQALETAWAAADNARDVAAVVAFYADDAVTLSNNQSMISGKANIMKDIETSLAKKPKGNTVSYDVMDVYGTADVVTEVGKITTKDAGGKVTYTGKYMAVWEKRDGKYVCVRDISNDDVKEK